ncbi:MAG: CsgG/HfaB family protein [Flavobacteriaceae bacterium]|nr:hypothetical protein [Flavobacteriaceae bacterium]
MKKIILLFVVVLHANFITSQVFDHSIEKISLQLSAKLNTYKNLKIAVYPFYDEVKKQSLAGGIVSDDLWSNLVNQAVNFNVIDRETLNYYMDEHQLNDDGLINPATAKQFGMLIAADAYVTGSIRIFATYIKLNIKAVDTETGTIIASGIGRLPLDYETASYLGIKDWREKKTETEQNRSTNPDCATKKLGDFCFENKTNVPYQIRINDINSNSPLSKTYQYITVFPGDTQCFRDLPTKKYNANIEEKMGGLTISNGNSIQFYIQTCEAGRYVIK